VPEELHVWEQIAVLVGGYALIVLSYAWVWVIAAGISRRLSAERMDRITRADVKAVVAVMAAWSIAWALMVAMEIWG
jgi:hypothetical protein